MLWLLTTRLACVLLVIYLSIGFGAGPAAATTYHLIATSLHKTFLMPHIPDYGGFEIRYEDANGSGSFSMDEVAPGWLFSGLSTDGDGSGAGYGGYWNELVTVPGPGYGTFTDGGPGGYWVFHRGYEPSTLTAPYDAWSYTQHTHGAVPLPPSVFLLGAGLMGLAAARRKKRSGP